MRPFCDSLSTLLMRPLYPILPSRSIPCTPPFYILYIFYTVNKRRWATKASLTFRRLLRTPRPQPNGRGGSPLPPAAHPDREAVSLKTCSPVFVSGTCGAQGETLVEPFVAPRSFFYIFYISYTVNPLPPPLSAFSASLREIFYFTRRDVKISTPERAYSRFYVKIRKKQPSGMLI